ncbi:DUF4232 domain-containing protein [Streptomyces kunmingensis]|uniref:DUF4232 domain-containing protein n=1 Tax=Streptomyces kunmingensis TaxID=68225 RepID=A0ABU6CI50_9ACTN|nr:DUF4232 domain-containing protein [Streptomyces kunmingensis]MEB3963646.1 DUF4232 domain-containing protein [Streptomyces kunmingensis]
MRTATTTARTARRRSLRIAAATLTAVAGLTLTACSGSDTGAKSEGRADLGMAADQAADRSADSGSQAQGSDARASGTGTGTGTDSAHSAGKQANSPQTGGKTKASIERCHTSGLKASFNTGGDAVPDPDADGATTTSVLLTNKGSAACTIGGFPGVDLATENGVDPATGGEGGRWSLARSSAKYSKITLQPGDSTDFTINVALTDDDEGFWAPAYALITPPDETTSITLAWPWSPLVDQRGATRPATFVNPIG